MNIFKTLIDLFRNSFLDFLKAVFSPLSKKLVEELKDFAIDTVKELQESDLTSAEKRKEAFKKIKAEAIERGLAFTESALYLIIELALQYVKNKTEDN